MAARWRALTSRRATWSMTMTSCRKSPPAPRIPPEPDAEQALLAGRGPKSRSTMPSLRHFLDALGRSFALQELRHRIREDR